jgi:transcriptional regulator with XRE-family HTH domain
MAHFGERLRLLRGRRSQKRVADELDIPPTTLSTLENQETLPRGEVLERLAKYFSVPVSYFFPTEPVKPTHAAKAYLIAIKGAEAGSRRVATHSLLNLDRSAEEKIDEIIGQKSAEASHKQ